MPNKSSDALAVRLFTAGLTATVKALEKVIGGIEVNPRPPVVDVFDLKDAIRYFSKADRGDPTIVAGALLVRPSAQGRYLLHHVFLDEQGQVCADDAGKPYGRRVVARHIGDALAARLAGGNDLVIFN